MTTSITIAPDGTFNIQTESMPVLNVAAPTERKIGEITFVRSEINEEKTEQRFFVNIDVYPDLPDDHPTVLQYGRYVETSFTQPYTPPVESEEPTPVDPEDTGHVVNPIASVVVLPHDINNELKISLNGVDTVVKNPEELSTWGRTNGIAVTDASELVGIPSTSTQRLFVIFQVAVEEKRTLAIELTGAVSTPLSDALVSDAQNLVTRLEETGQTDIQVCNCDANPTTVIDLKQFEQPAQQPEPELSRGRRYQLLIDPRVSYRCAYTAPIGSDTTQGVTVQGDQFIQWLNSYGIEARFYPLEVDPNLVVLDIEVFHPLECKLEIVSTQPSVYSRSITDGFAKTAQAIVGPYSYTLASSEYAFILAFQFDENKDVRTEEALVSPVGPTLDKDTTINTKFFIDHVGFLFSKSFVAGTTAKEIMAAFINSVNDAYINGFQGGDSDLLIASQEMYHKTAYFGYDSALYGGWSEFSRVPGARRFLTLVNVGNPENVDLLTYAGVDKNIVTYCSQGYNEMFGLL